MSETRRLKRKLNFHMNALGILLSDFYQLLESTPKPSDQEVRETFISYDDRWKKYCVNKGLSKTIAEEFKRQVSEVWRHKAGENH